LLFALVTAVTALFCYWGVNAELLGARNTGSAIFLALAGTVALIAATYAVPVLVILGLIMLLIERRSAFRVLVAGAVCAAPIAVLTWLERI